MRTQLTLGAAATFCIVTSAVLWIEAVPNRLSGATFGWTIATAFFVAIFTAAFIARARPTRAIAHVLYDVEHPGERT